MASSNESANNAVLMQWLWLAFLLLALGGSIASNIYFGRSHVASGEQERLFTQTRVIAENMEHQLSSANRALESVLNELPSWDRERKSRAAELHLKALSSAMQGIRFIGVMDADGVLRASNLTAYIGQNYSYREYFQTVKQRPSADTLYVSPPFKSADGVFVVNVTRMIPDKQGHFAGVVIASLDPDYFHTLMNSVLYASDMWDAIAHGDGKLFVMMPERKDLQGMNLAQPGSFFTRHLDSGQQTSVFAGKVYLTGERRMMAQRTVQPAALKMDKPLVVAVCRDLDAIYEPWQRGALTQAGLFGLIAILSVLGLYIYQRRQREFEQKSAEAAAALRQSAERLQLASEASGVGVWDFDVVTGRLLWDDSMYTLYGIDKSVRAGLFEAWWGRVLPEDMPAAEAALKATLEQGAPYTPCFRIYRGDDELRYIQARAKVYFDAAGKALRLVGTNEDITSRRQEEAALQESEERFRSTFDAAAIGMALVNLDGRFIQANEALCRIVGYTQAELQQKTVYSLTHPADLEADRALVIDMLDGKRTTYQAEKRYFHKDGHIIWILLTTSIVHDTEGKPRYFAAQMQDFTERKLLQSRLEQQANQDYLTGLFNRRYFMDRGQIELARAQRYGNTLSLFMLDIDHFKEVNDSYGHKAGDIVLQKLSEVMRETLRTIDVIGRIGGEEFAILLPEADLAQAAEAAERLREKVASTDVVLEAGLPLRFTVSIGVTALTEKSEVNLDILLNRADKALYQAKEQGRNRVCVI